MILTRIINFSCLRNRWVQSKETKSYGKEFLCGVVQDKQKRQFVNEATDELAFTEADLDAFEKNIALRKQSNNMPVLRKLLTELHNTKEDASDIRIRIRTELKKIPNATHKRLFAYGDDPLEVMRFESQQPKQEQAAIINKEFSEICNRIFRIEHLGNYTGHKSYYLMGPLALLEQALVRYALCALKNNHFRLVSVPDILPSAVIEGCGMQTEGDRTQVYKLDTGQCLSGTSEMALAGFFAGKVFEEKDLPIKVAAVSRCFRAETSGLHEEKGIYRVHQFTKVEMFALCVNSQSEEMLETFKNVEISLFQKLMLNFRLLDMNPSELGAPAYEKYDIEAWMPGRKMWGEISSCSNCTDYQAKRLNIRYRTKDKQLKYVHTVNGTAAAIPRLLISIIESNQDGNGTVLIPTSLKGFIKIKEIAKDKNIPEIKLVKFIKDLK